MLPEADETIVIIAENGATNTVIVEGQTVVLEDVHTEILTAAVQGPSGPRGHDGADGDKTFEQTFAVAASLTVTHGLNKRPMVTVIDSAGDEVEGEVVYLGPNSLSVTFSAPFSGTVICN